MLSFKPIILDNSLNLCNSTEVAVFRSADNYNKHFSTLLFVHLLMTMGIVLLKKV